MKRIFLITILSIVLVNCDSNNESSKKTQDINFTTISRGFVDNNPFLDNPKSQNIIISDNATWEVFLNDLNRPIDNSIDFETHQIICVFDLMRPSGEYNIEIISVNENQSSIVVNIKTSKGNEQAIQMPIQPFHIVKIPKSNKPVVFK